MLILRKNTVDEDDDSFAEVRRLVEATERGVTPNDAHSLRGMAAMAREYGHEVDPDRIEGARGRQVDEAMDRYKTFHDKEPLRIVDLGHKLPSSVVCIGDALAVMYRTDKWHKDGDDEDYKHLHDKNENKPYDIGKGVKLYEPAREARKSVVDGVRANFAAKSQKPPVKYPEVMTKLGYCLGLFVRRYDDEEIYELNPRGCDLMCSPSGNMLALFSPEPQPDGSVGFLCIMAGGGLRVLKGGIDG